MFAVRQGLISSDDGRGRPGIDTAPLKARRVVALLNHAEGLEDICDIGDCVGFCGDVDHFSVVGANGFLLGVF